MRTLVDRDHRRAIASWRKGFKREWKTLAIRSKMIENPIQKYHTSPTQWSCGCPSFLNSRFLICKHIIFFYEPISDPVRFFRNVRRQRSPPFWIDEQLILKPEHRPSELQNVALTTDERFSSDSDRDIDPETANENALLGSDAEEDIDPEAINEDQLVSDSESEEDTEPSANSDGSDSDNEHYEIRRFVSNAGKWAKLMEEQETKGNYKFLKKLWLQIGG
jgi:hypothetical protein